ncbi:hypothetical protein OESDEN_18446 [Oesophagostomum dentatum]|uniref:Collagenase NC10/endostatin domain-containing protein n=1 Tax=Oesophagostomum dentatum TaxID=61180 RepID=A0A0B1SF64_OESDE|nr:hypothetical protein OESDEN_18446 [Oesophagostomum dentatum]
MYGMRGADLQCYREARMAGFTTTFRAMLSNNVQDMLRIVHTADWDTPVVNIRGEHSLPKLESSTERWTAQHSSALFI